MRRLVVVGRVGLGEWVCEGMGFGAGMRGWRRLGVDGFGKATVL